MKDKIISTLFLFACLVFSGLQAKAQNLNLDPGFAPTVDGYIAAIAVQSDQKILIGGTFNAVNGASRYKIARLNQDGSVDTSFDASAIVTSAHSVNSVKILAGGKILLSGYFGDVGLDGFKRIVRLNSNGSLDSTFTSFPYTINSFSSPGTVLSVEGLADGKILACGDFASANGTGRSYLARYNADGSFDATFQTTIDRQCRDTLTLPDGKVLIGGLFLNINGVNRSSLARLNSDATVDSSFIPDFGIGAVYKIAIQPTDGKIVAFTASGISKVVRVNSDGSQMQTFSASVSGNGVAAIAFQTNGKILLGGNNISNGNGNTTQFARLNSEGTYDLSLNPLTFDNDIKALAVQADGKILVAGLFQFVNGVSRQKIARLIPDAVNRKTAFDFDGDLKADVSVFRPSTGIWYLNRSSAGFTAVPFGQAGDKLVSADYDGDGKNDFAVYRGGVWYILRSSNSTFTYTFFGNTGDIPQTGDYDGDGKADLALFSPRQTPVWLIQRSTQGAIALQIGSELPTDKPVPADYDGDGITDIAVYRSGTWLVKGSINGAVQSYLFGASEDRPVTGDFDGDGKFDIAVFRPSNGTWYLRNTTQGFYAVPFGISTDLPVPADFDGDGKTDVAVFRSGTWYELRSNGNVFYGEQFGASTDIPVPAQAAF